MSAPDTNKSKQERRHWPALWGIKGAMIFGVAMLLFVILYTSFYAGEPDAVTNTDQAEEGTATVPEVSVEPGTND